MEHNLQRTWHTDNKRVHNINIDSTCKCSAERRFQLGSISKLEAVRTGCITHLFIQPKGEAKCN